MIVINEAKMRARIYQPAKSAMTSGQGNSKSWVLEYAPAEARRIDPLMGWTDVKKDMKGRYPKHPWPDDPLAAIATRRTKNRM